MLSLFYVNLQRYTDGGGERIHLLLFPPYTRHNTNVSLKSLLNENIKAAFVFKKPVSGFEHVLKI